MGRWDNRSVPSATASAVPAWRSRIVGSGEEAPDQLLANPANWRLHPKAQQDALAGLLGQVGWVQQVLVNRRTGHVVDGHLRVALAIGQEAPTVPVLYVDLEPEEEALVLASLDPLAAMASTDDEQLRALLDSVTVDSDDLAAMLKALRPRPLGRTDPDLVPPVPDEPYVKVGELWLLGDHRLVVGDATDPDAVARLLDGAEPRLMVTDPPYGVRLDPRWRNGVYNALGESAAPYMLSHQNTDISGDTIIDWSPAFELVPSIEVAYVWHAGVHGAEVARGIERLGMEIRSQIIWVKEHLVISRGDYHWQHEPCWYAVRTGRTARWVGKHDLATTWTLASPKAIMGGSREEKEDHPAQKPIECMERPIRHHEGDVYDPFLGSGTTLLAAEREGRRCYAMEVEPRYAQLSIERWQRYTAGEAVRG